MPIIGIPLVVPIYIAGAETPPPALACEPSGLIGANAILAPFLSVCHLGESHCVSVCCSSKLSHDSMAVKRMLKNVADVVQM